MDLHSQLMNLPCNALHAGSPQADVQRAYQEGHKRARHDAAELANAADIELARLQGALAQLARYFTSGNSVPVERATIRAEDFWRITGLAPLELRE